MNQAASAPASREAAIRIGQADALQRHVPELILGNTVVALLFAVVMAGGAPSGGLLAWLGLQWTLGALSYARARRIRARPTTARNVQRRLRATTLGNAAAGLLWMAGLWLFWPPGNLEAQWMMGMIVLGMVPAALFSLNAWLPAFHAFFLPCMAGLVAAALRENSTTSITFAVTGVLFALSILRFARQGNGTLIEALRAQREVSELVDRLAVEKDRAEQANLAKSRFLAAASHDLRQPVHALSLFVGALAAQPPGPEAQRMLARISSTVGGMGAMFDALLDVSKLDAGVVGVDAREFDLQAMVENLCAQERPVATARGLVLRVNARPALVHSDPLLFERILRNLLSNALRYTDRGGVLVTLRLRGRDAVVRVFDTGIGIAPERQADVFEEFVQLHNPERDRNQGLGLGLAIVRRMTRLLGVRLALRSRVGRGTGFSLRVPAVQTPPRPAAALAAPVEVPGPVRAGALLLVIDDDEDVRAGMQSLLTGWGYRVIAAAGVADLLPQLRQTREIPALIISDYRLKDDATGAQAIERVRSEYNDDDLPAILVTGDTAPQRLIDASAAGHLLLHKPLAPAVLRERVASLIARPAPPPEPAG